MDQITIGGQVVEFKHVFYSWVCMAVLFVVAYLVRRRLTLVPGGMQNFFEALIDTIENFICNTMGEAGRRFVPLLAGMFIYIFGMNLLGLIPGFDAPTANLNTTGAWPCSCSCSTTPWASSAGRRTTCTTSPGPPSSSSR